MVPRMLEIEARDGERLHATWLECPGKSNVRNPIVILCHGFRGDRHEWGRFPEAAAALEREGVDAIFFDFTGCGENARKPVMLSKQIADLEDIYKWALDKGYSRIGTIGLSFGGLVSLRATLPRRTVAVFWAPAWYMHKILGKARLFFGKLLLMRGRTMKIDAVSGFLLMKKQFFLDIEANIDLIDDTLSRFTTPSLVVQGLEDHVVHPDWTRAAFACMPRDENHQIVEIPRATHDFKGMELKEFIETSVKWIRTRIST
jgi:pimeloyl-ACP methyl ester carboxylesterase